ncbi:universal stress protein [uncultured Tateyamaria sp.]|uniref:universal stress protein n=1 Tax=uncultured Tateyamaria sp. TaxID=455651 RepID=UPI00260C8356|nr:universal stress protein [uncultured Tateyamaria sp.]
MYNKVLVAMALDHDVSAQTLGIARTLLNEGGEVVALHVHEAPEGTVRAYLDENTMAAGFEKARVDMEAKLATFPDVTGALVEGHSARAIIDYAATHDVDCIVIGSHKPGLSDYFLGSTAARVVRHAPCAVHVHRSKP